MKRVRRVVSMAALALLAFYATGSPLTAGQKPPTVSQVRADFEARGYNGEYDPAAIQDALKAAGATPAEMDAELAKINRIVDKAKAKKKDAGKDQNASGNADWNFGQVYRGATYNVNFPLTNACRIGQTVTITYPPSMDLTGPVTVDVPAKSTVEVPLVLKIPELNIPPGPIPIGTNFMCTPIDGQITMVHPEVKRVETTPAGKYTYVCHGMKQTYSISMHEHIHDAPDPPGGGGGGGKPDKKKKTNTCDIYWSTGEFEPDKDHLTPESCKSDIEELAFQMLTQDIAPLEKEHDPGLFAWLPKSMDPAKVMELNLKAAIRSVPSADLMEVRLKADQTVKKLQRDTSKYEWYVEPPKKENPQ